MTSAMLHAHRAHTHAHTPLPLTPIDLPRHWCIALQGLVGVSYTLDLVPPHLVAIIVTNTHIVSPGQVPWLLHETFGAAV